MTFEPDFDVPALKPPHRASEPNHPAFYYSVYSVQLEKPISACSTFCAETFGEMDTHRSKHMNRPQRGRLNGPAIITLVLLLAAPGYALSRLMAVLDWRLVAGIALVLSLFAFFAYRSDKRRAETGAWRVPEMTLHLIALIGGWPGAFLAQRTFRHKTSKFSFQVVFWMVVLFHQFVAIDFLLDWRLTKGTIQAIKSQTA